MRIIRPLVRKATKTVVYTAVPISGPLKAATMGTRNGRLTRKEAEKQTQLLAQQNALLQQQAHAAQVAHSTPPMVTPDGMWVSYDGGETYQATGRAPATAPNASWYMHPSQQTISADTMAAMQCMSCKAGFEVPATQIAYTCPSCSGQFHLRLCPNCSKVIHVPQAVAGKAVKCLSCSKASPWMRWEQRPVTASQYARVVLGAQVQPPAPAPAQLPPPPPSDAPPSMADEIAKLAKLRADGVLSDAEFAAAKARVLG